MHASRRRSLASVAVGEFDQGVPIDGVGGHRRDLAVGHGAQRRRSDVALEGHSFPEDGSGSEFGESLTFTSTTSTPFNR